MYKIKLLYYKRPAYLIRKVWDLGIPHKIHKLLSFRHFNFFVNVRNHTSETESSPTQRIWTISLHNLLIRSSFNNHQQQPRLQTILTSFLYLIMQGFLQPKTSWDMSRKLAQHITFTLDAGTNPLVNITNKPLPLSF